MSDAAIAGVVVGAVNITTLIVGFLTLWIKLRYGERKVTEAATKAEENAAKLDENTQITKGLSRKLNGGLDEALAQAVAPLKETLAVHERQIAALVEYQHKAKHDLAGSLQTIAMKLELVRRAVGGGEPPHEPQ